MLPVRPEFAPDPSLSREEMETMQREIAALATFSDDLGFEPASIEVQASIRSEEYGEQAQIGDTITSASPSSGQDPVVVGVDQAFLDDRAVSAIVALQDGDVVERVHAVSPLSIPYIPGLLSFREGGPILAAFEALTVEPDVALFDGSGRIHYRQAGLATHLGVVLDLPSVGVAKRLLCGRPRGSVDELPEGTRVAIEGDERVEGAEGEVVGYAVQTRQFPTSKRINPLYVSPGHRVCAETAADLVQSTAGEYKLPEPIRLADTYVGEVRDDLAR